MSTLIERLIAGVTLLGGASAVFVVGYSIGKDTNEGTMSFIRERHQMLERAEAQVRAENTALKLELQTAKSASVSLVRSSLSGAVSGQAGSIGQLNTKPKTESGRYKVILHEGQSVDLIDGQIVLSLIATTFVPNPLRHTVTATIGSPGKSSKALENVDVGFAVVYEGHEFRVLSADTFTTEFLVVRLGPKET